MAGRLFVYGTLAPGRPNQHVLADVDGTWEPATVAGTLVHEGWGAELGFPAIVLDAAGPAVVEGFLFSSSELDAHWERLDAFEGEGYERLSAPVRVAGSRVETADVYVLRQPPASVSSVQAQ